MNQVDTDLAAWVRLHCHLRPTEVENGESGMALLILWEVEHGEPFPCQGGSSCAAVLLGFTRRLKRRVAADAALSAWMETRELQQPLAPGLADTHHTRGSLRLQPPGPDEPREWYEEFVLRWRAYLATQAHPVVLPASCLPSPVFPLPLTQRVYYPSLQALL
jgi:hypothetical protein